MERGAILCRARSRGWWTLETADELELNLLARRLPTARYLSHPGWQYPDLIHRDDIR